MGYTVRKASTFAAQSRAHAGPRRLGIQPGSCSGAERVFMLAERAKQLPRAVQSHNSTLVRAIQEQCHYKYLPYYYLDRGSGISDYLTSWMNWMNALPIRETACFSYQNLTTTLWELEAGWLPSNGYYPYQENSELGDFTVYYADGMHNTWTHQGSGVASVKRQRLGTALTSFVVPEDADIPECLLQPELWQDEPLVGDSQMNPAIRLSSLVSKTFVALSAAVDLFLPKPPSCIK